MAHKIVSGTDRIATTDKRTVWHAYETEQDGRLVEVPFQGDAETTLLQMAGHVWPIDAENDVARIVPIQTAEGIAAPDFQATVSASGRVLGIVSKDYEKVPFRVITTELCLALARAGGRPSTLGTFDAGRNFFSCFEVAQSWRVPGDHSDTHAFCNIIANHTGDGAIRTIFESFRDVCANTAELTARNIAAAGTADAFAAAITSIRHTGNVQERLRMAAQWIANGEQRAMAERELLAHMAGRKLSMADVAKFIDQYIFIAPDATDRIKAGRERERESFYATARDTADLGNHALAASGITAYGLYQAVTRFEDHVTRVNQVQDVPVGTRRAFRAFLNERGAEKNMARELILEMSA